MDDSLRLDASFVDYGLVVVYFAVVLLIGFAARRRVSDSLDFVAVFALWSRLRPVLVEEKN